MSEITLADIQAAWPAIQAASSTLMEQFGPKFTGTPEGHVATDVAASSAIAGRMLLEESGIDLTVGAPGSTLLWESHEAEGALFTFMRAAAGLLGIDFEIKPEDAIPADHEAKFDTNAMTDRLREPLLAASDGAGLEARFRPYVAVWTAMKLFAAGKQLELLPESVGRTIATQGVLRGARTIPNRS